MKKKILRFPPIPKLHFCSLGTCKLCNITIWEVVEVKSKMYCNLELETLYYQAQHKTMYATKNPANGIVEIYWRISADATLTYATLIDGKRGPPWHPHKIPSKWRTLCLLQWTGGQWIIWYPTSWDPWNLHLATLDFTWESLSSLPLVPK